MYAYIYINLYTVEIVIPLNMLVYLCGYYNNIRKEMNCRNATVWMLCTYVTIFVTIANTIVTYSSNHNKETINNELSLVLLKTSYRGASFLD